MKGRRQDKILEIIEKYEVTTQEELADRLNEAGFRVTQATVSRDIRELHLFKVAGSSGRQKYAALPGKEEEGVASRYMDTFRAVPESRTFHYIFFPKHGSVLPPGFLPAQIPLPSIQFCLPTDRKYPRS